MGLQRGVPLRARLRNIRILLCDVDGVLTDGSVWMGQGTELKGFNIQDGLGLVLLRRAGIKIGWLSSRPSTATDCRAQELKIDFLWQEKGSKLAGAEQFMAEAGACWEQVCYVGDDLVDLGALRLCGVAVAVANAVPEVKRASDVITRRAGGGGAIREVAEMILKAQLKWNEIVAEYGR
jgi:3-deoxy-D-manno-octulosonate 8-phosphate phosphatase (KDO 8-P phosphatase)